MENLEQRIALLEHQATDLEQTLSKLKAISEIQFLMGQYVVYWQSPKTWKKALDLYADRPDSSHEDYTGYYVGMDALRGHLDPVDGFEKETGLTEEGTFFQHHLASPIIQVADDLQTARGLWWSPGAESDGGKGANGEPLPLWCYGKYCNDFIKVDGEWKIWHTHFYVTFRTPYNLSWVDVPDEIRRGGDGAPGAQENHYNPKGVFLDVPHVPAPYTTWTDDRMRP